MAAVVRMTRVEPYVVVISHVVRRSASAYVLCRSWCMYQTPTQTKVAGNARHQPSPASRWSVVGTLVVAWSRVVSRAGMRATATPAARAPKTACGRATARTPSVPRAPKNGCTASRPATLGGAAARALAPPPLHVLVDADLDLGMLLKLPAAAALSFVGMAHVRSAHRKHLRTEDAVDHDEEVVRGVGGDGVAPDIDTLGDRHLGAHRHRRAVLVTQRRPAHSSSPCLSLSMGWGTVGWERREREVEQQQ